MSGITREKIINEGRFVKKLIYKKEKIKEIVDD